MGKYILSFFLFFGFTISLPAQDTLSHTDNMYIHTKKILNSLIRATGNIYPSISLEIVDTKGNIASSKAPKYQIILEKGAYRICMALPAEKQDAALAFILGHELAHIYHHHGKDSEQHFACITEFSKSTAHTVEEDAVESQADEYGFFYARIAGYSTTGIEEDLFNALYDYLKAENIMPPKEGRILMAKENSRKIQPYIDLYRLAEKLMIEKEYAIAAIIYHHILQHLTSPEMYLNTAVAEILYAKSIQKKELLAYTFPLLFDTESQTERSEEVEGRENDAPIILQKVDSLLQIVCERYKPCPQATLYLAYNHYLQSLENKAIPLQKDIEMIDAMTVDSLLLPYKSFLQGIFKATTGKKEEALHIFQDKNIQTRFPAEAAENSYLLESQESYTPPACETEKYVEDEYLNGINQLSEESMNGANLIRLYNQYEKDSLLISIKNVPKLCNYYEVRGKKIVQFIETEKDYPKNTTTGLHIHDLAANVLKKYGQPCQKVSLPETAFYHYFAHRQIVFRIKAGKIVGWYLYSIK
jgi:hypothetical protein